MFGYQSILSAKYDEIEMENATLAKENHRLDKDNKELERLLRTVSERLNGGEKERSADRTYIVTLEGANNLLKDENTELTDECDKEKRYNKTLVKENNQLQDDLDQSRDENERLRKDVNAIYILFNEAADAGDEARAEVHSLQARVKELEQFNTTAVNRCAEKQSIIEMLKLKPTQSELDGFKAKLRESGLQLIELAK